MFLIYVLQQKRFQYEYSGQACARMMCINPDIKRMGREIDLKIQGKSRNSGCTHQQCTENMNKGKKITGAGGLSFDYQHKCTHIKVTEELEIGSCWSCIRSSRAFYQLHQKPRLSFN